MFTGIITDMGEVVARDGGRFTLLCSYDAGTIAIGASIACDGCCLTATEITAQKGGMHFTVDVSNETLARTTLGEWHPGRRINLERSLKLGDEMGGHLVTGHVDGLARILAATPDGNSVRFSFEVPNDLARYIATKGSVALDGTSLTVNEVSGNTFGVAIIPHTRAVTTWGQRSAGDAVNIEVDLLARYVARLAAIEK
jgi:riboflavin synthase